MPAAACRNQFFKRRCHAPQPSQGYRRQAETAGGCVRVGPPGLSGLGWSELTAVRGFVEWVVAARRGGHPAPPLRELLVLDMFTCRSNKTPPDPGSFFLPTRLSTGTTDTLKRRDSHPKMRSNTVLRRPPELLYNSALCHGPRIMAAHGACIRSSE